MFIYTHRQPQPRKDNARAHSTQADRGGRGTVKGGRLSHGSCTHSEPPTLSQGLHTCMKATVIELQVWRLLRVESISLYPNQSGLRKAIQLPQDHTASEQEN